MVTDTHIFVQHLERELAFSTRVVGRSRGITNAKEWHR